MVILVSIKGLLFVLVIVYFIEIGCFYLICLKWWVFLLEEIWGWVIVDKVIVSKVNMKSKLCFICFCFIIISCLEYKNRGF